MKHPEDTGRTRPCDPAVLGQACHRSATDNPREMASPALAQRLAGVGPGMIRRHGVSRVNETGDVVAVGVTSGESCPGVGQHTGQW